MTRHEFLAELHRLLKPKIYLEIGVQHGTSLRLAGPDTLAYGVDPDPAVVDNHDGRLFRCTSDDFFGITMVDEDRDEVLGGPVDLGFIDGMHLVEYALRDFIGMERLSSPRGVIVFDDVLPTTQAMAARNQCPGDWTGDVWRIEPILSKYRLDLDLIPVNTFPTGLLIVTNLNPNPGNTRLTDFADDIATRWPDEDTTVPPYVLHRSAAWEPDMAFKAIADWWRIVSAQPTQQEVVP